ncbi:MAG TPA: hypothetical protein VHQ90_08550 [Thermoanaerobaculia bacterium]|jgi:hypothetical protein|nr:hypothetical protein [Thermoanaerobaculia bacterium]
MATPDYLVCLDCETPCYDFDWQDGTIREALCRACGNDDPDEFALPEDIDEGY